MSRLERVVAHAQQNLDATASAGQGERYSQPVHMMARLSTAGRVEPGGRGRPTLHPYAPGRKWASEIAFLDSISGCGTTPLTSNLIHHNWINAHEKVLF